MTGVLDNILNFLGTNAYQYGTNSQGAPDFVGGGANDPVHIPGVMVGQAAATGVQNLGRNLLLMAGIGIILVAVITSGDDD